MNLKAKEQLEKKIEISNHIDLLLEQVCILLRFLEKDLTDRDLAYTLSSIKDAYAEIRAMNTFLNY